MKQTNQILNIIFYSSFVLLFGCSAQNAVESSLESYINDLNRSVWVDIRIKEPSLDLLPIPSVRDRRFELAQFDIGILDFLSLQQCDVGAVVGHKNSILGKVMPDSQRLLYELNLIRAIDSCHIESDSLRSELFAARNVKKSELIKAFSNSLWAGRESSAFFSLSNGLISMSPDRSSFTLLQNSLNYLAGLMSNLHHVPKVSSNSLEGHFQNIYESEYAGKLLLTLLMLTKKLNDVSEGLESIHVSGEFCDKPIQFLKQQFKAHYLNKIQPYMARVNSVAFRVLPVINQFKAQTQPLTGSFNDFLAQWSMTSSSSKWKAYQEASKRHALSWNGLFQKCSVTLNQVINKAEE
ncbi:DUF3080 family protein [Marinomonas sp. 2405UD68-3]|uniref:DUF3080 family protein n=1 Tax=Marinomonas sp. 2405UD68-3 TaxID=3391835 RepID=UPI0039C94141